MADWQIPRKESKQPPNFVVISVKKIHFPPSVYCLCKVLVPLELF